MKKLFAFLFTLLASISAHGLYLGNPYSPEMIEKGFVLSNESIFGLKVGYLGDFVFDRNLTAHGSVQGRIDSFSLLTNQGVITCNLFDRFEVYGLVGATGITFSHRPPIDRKRRKYSFHNQFSWGGGARIVLFDWDQFTCAASAAYQQAHPSMRWMTLNGVSLSPKGSIIYREWQGGLALSYHIDLFIPYIGVVYSHVHAQMEHLPSDLELNTHHFSLGSREHFGLVIGTSFSNAHIIDLTAEIRFFSELALSLAANVQF